MQRKTKWIGGGVLAVAIIGGGTGIGVATSGDDDAPFTGSALDRAVATALETTGGGTVTETEVGDDGSAYSVEIRLPDGRQVEVNIDENYRVIGQDADDDGASDSDGASED